MNTVDAVDIKTSYHKAADLVKSWGQSVLSDGRTIEQALTIEGLPFWSAISSTLAFDHISRVLPRSPGQAVPGNHGRTLAHRVRQAAFDAGLPLIAGRSGCKRWPENPAFLFLGFTRNMYRETLQPVAARLARHADHAVVVLDERFPWQAGSAFHDDTFHSLWQHWGDDAARIRRAMLKALKVSSRLIMGPSGLPKIVAASGPAWETVRPLFEWLFDVYLPRLTATAAVALHIIEQHRPALLISPDVNDPRARIYCLAGRLEAIKTLEIQFGVYGTNDIEWRFFLADHLAVTGEANLQVMLDHGIPRERMTVTGSPRYDSVLFWPPELAQNVRRGLNIPAGKVMVLFASQPYYYGTFSRPDVRREMIQALFRETSKQTDLVLVVKPHPLEDPAELTVLARGVGNILVADKELDIRDLIKASNAFVTFFSNTTFDALVMNKPTINLAYPGGCASSLIEESGATFVVKNDNDISSALRAIGTGHISTQIKDHSSARELFLDRWLYRLDGHSAQRIESLALAMASLGSTSRHSLSIGKRRSS